MNKKFYILPAVVSLLSISSCGVNTDYFIKINLPNELSMANRVTYTTYNSDKKKVAYITNRRNIFKLINLYESTSYYPFAESVELIETDISTVTFEMDNEEFTIRECHSYISFNYSPWYAYNFEPLMNLHLFGWEGYLEDGQDEEQTESSSELTGEEAIYNEK